MVGKGQFPAEWFIAGKFAMREVSVSPSQFPRAKFSKIFRPVSSAFCGVKGAETHAGYGRKGADSSREFCRRAIFLPVIHIRVEASGAGYSGVRVKLAKEGRMQVFLKANGWLRAIFVGGGWAFGLLAIGLLVGLPQSIQADRESVIIGGGSAILSALSFVAATRMPKNPSWPLAIAGWIAGFFLLPGIVRLLVGIVDLIFR
ncbi:MAG: hypothetical protein HY242_09465 [Afipia sp.]|nr:hypothetical protein [Afipia sp.]